MENATLEMNGYGYGDGSGDGYGDGSGDGSGDGYGDGSGDGYGYGYGSGYGYGDCETVYYNALLDQHKSHGVIVAFWRCHSDNTPANGGKGTVAAAGKIEEIDGPLAICTKKALHGTLNPRKWEGSHWWIVALHEPVHRDEDKIGSLKRTFLVSLGKCPFQ